MILNEEYFPCVYSHLQINIVFMINFNALLVIYIFSEHFSKLNLTNAIGLNENQIKAKCRATFFF